MRTVAAMLLAAVPPSAQAAGRDPDPDCQVSPENRSEHLRPDDWAQFLEKCEGILTPPAIGDREFVQPPPPTGRARIIRPGELPPNTNGVEP